MMTSRLTYCCVVVVVVVVAVVAATTATSEPRTPLVATGLNALEAMIRFYRRESSAQDAWRNRDTPGKKIFKQGTYDFIVIGGGTAGSVVANRLSANPDWKVLLLEAGKDESILNEIPALTSFFALTDGDWGYSTEPQSRACLAMTGGRCVWPRGKMLGGTSSINHMIYSRGSRGDYDEWARLGNVGWHYDAVLPYFQRSEDVRIPALRGSSTHSTGGEVSVEAAPYHTPLGGAFLRAGTELGYDLTPDYNDPDHEIGFSYNQVLMRDGLRCSASKSFLRPIRKRRNLHISLESRVTKIIIDPVTKQTRGVEFTKDRLLFTVKTRREVVLCAGALNSPQILMLSGVGPRQHLQELGIAVIQDSMVGHNLQDHVSFLGLTFTVDDTVTNHTSMRAQYVQNMLRFVVNGTGPMTSSAATESLAFVRTKYARDSRPDVEFLYVSAGLSSDRGGPLVTKGVGISPDFYERVYRSIEARNVWSIIPIVLHPRSRGVIRLIDKNPFHRPLFYPNTFSDPHDLQVLVEGIKIALKVADTAAFRAFGSRLHRVPVPGCSHLAFGGDAYWSCACTYLTGANHHQVGTCKMGPAWDQDAVVDPQLRVYGVGGLRVADASIIPLEVTGHTTAPAYMIGEKAADMIIDSHRNIDWYRHARL